MNTKLLLLSLLLAPALSACAQDLNGALRVRMADGSPLVVELDGRRFRKHGTSITVGDLPPGRHWLKVYAYTQDQNRGQADLLFDGKVKTKPGTVTLATLDPSTGSLDVVRDNAANFMAPADGSTQQPPMENQGNTGMQPNDFGNSNNNNGNSNNSNNANNTNNGNSNDDNSAPVASPVSSVSQSTLNDLKHKADKLLTDTKKLTEIESGLKGQSLTVAQVSTIMDWLNFETSRLQFAEWAYNITVDSQNYRSLDSKFSFDRNRTELDNFVANGGKN